MNNSGDHNSDEEWGWFIDIDKYYIDTNNHKFKSYKHINFDKHIKLDKHLQFKKHQNNLICAEIFNNNIYIKINDKEKSDFNVITLMLIFVMILFYYLFVFNF